MRLAYKRGDGRKIDGRRVMVDVERGRTVRNWLVREIERERQRDNSFVPLLDDHIKSIHTLIDRIYSLIDLFNTRSNNWSLALPLWVL